MGRVRSLIYSCDGPSCKISSVTLAAIDTFKSARCVRERGEREEQFSRSCVSFASVGIEESVCDDSAVTLAAPAEVRAVSLLLSKRFGEENNSRAERDPQLRGIYLRIFPLFLLSVCTLCNFAYVDAALFLNLIVTTM